MRKVKVGKIKIRQYTVQDVMDILQISKVTALKLLKTGQLRSVRIGRQHWINEGDLIDFLLGDPDRQNKNYGNAIKNNKKNPLTRFIVKRLLK